MFLDDLDDLSRAANAAQHRRSTLNASQNHQRNQSPTGLQNMSQPSISNDFDISDLANQDFIDTSPQNGASGINSSVNLLDFEWNIDFGYRNEKRKIGPHKGHSVNEKNVTLKIWKQKSLR